MRAFWGADSLHIIPQISLHMPVELRTPHSHMATHFEKQTHAIAWRYSDVRPAYRISSSPPPCTATNSCDLTASDDLDYRPATLILGSRTRVAALHGVGNYCILFVMKARRTVKQHFRACDISVFIHISLLAKGTADGDVVLHQTVGPHADLRSTSLKASCNMLLATLATACALIFTPPLRLCNCGKRRP
jgi:hypothetical protein